MSRGLGDVYKRQLYYLVYNTVNKEFKWRFTKGIYDDEEGRPTSGYYIAKYPRNI